jgi:hypothetical protein
MGVLSEARGEAGLFPDGPALNALAEKKIDEVTRSLQEMVHGFDFARVLALYCRAHLAEDGEAKARVVKWFRGEYANKTEARRELGVNAVITDDDWYEYVKLFALFLRRAGYQGLIILIDELVNLYKIPNSLTRQYNYEKILTMYNDALQGKARYLGLIMCGTPRSMDDARRGVYSYEALRSRLAEGRFSQGGLTDVLAPVIKLAPLTYEEMLVLAEKLADIHAALFDYEGRLTQDDLIHFIKTEFSRIGADTRLTPREVIRDFIEVLNIAHQNPEVAVETILAQNFSYAKPPLEEDAQRFAEFAEFEL